MKVGNFESKLSDIEMTEIEHRREVQQKHYFDPEPIVKHKPKPKEQPDKHKTKKREDYTTTRTTDPRHSEAFDRSEDEESKYRQE